MLCDDILASINRNDIIFDDGNAPTFVEVHNTQSYDAFSSADITQGQLNNNAKQVSYWI